MIDTRKSIQVYEHLLQIVKYTCSHLADITQNITTIIIATLKVIK